MQSAELTLRSLHLLSPDLADDFREQLEAAVNDCRQRPSLAAARKITVSLEITPHPSDPDDVEIQPVLTSKTPARKLSLIRARRTPRNQLQFDFDIEESE